MNVLNDRIPHLLKQAVARKALGMDWGASLRLAEQALVNCRAGTSWARGFVADDIARTWVKLAEGPDQAEAWLCRYYGSFNSSFGWTSVSRIMGRLAGSSSSIPGESDAAVKYILRAEEFAETCWDWCLCAEAWYTGARNMDRALHCLGVAEAMAVTFFHLMDCAHAWSVISEYDRAPVIDRVRMGERKAITSQDWRRCVYELAGGLCQRDDPATLDEMETCLQKVLATAATPEGYRLAAFSANFNLRRRGRDLVARALDAGDKVCRTTEDWGGQIVTLAVLISQRQFDPCFDPSLSCVDELKDRYSACVQRFSACRPISQDWLKVIRRSCRQFPVLSAPDLMARAEAGVQTAQDWLDCASLWATMKCPDAQQKASRCRLKGWRALRMMPA